jgi:hypothetical protein
MMVITAEERARGHRPILYAWLRDDVVLYIGCSSKGIERPLGVGHEKLREMQPGDQVLIWPAQDSGPHLYQQQELELICRHRPPYNKPNGGVPCPGCGGRWKLRERAAGCCDLCLTRHSNGHPLAAALEKLT